MRLEQDSSSLNGVSRIMRTDGLSLSFLRPLASVLVGLVLVVVAAPASAATVLDGVAGPYNSFASFKKAADAAKKAEPAKVAVLFIQALIARSMDEKLGNSMIAQLAEPGQRKKCAGCEGGFSIGRYLEDEINNLESYVLEGYCGGTPKGSYADADLKSCVPSIDAVYSAKMQGIKGARAKYFFSNGGSGRPRPINLKLLSEGEGKSGEVWLVSSASGLITGVAPPAK